VNRVACIEGEALGEGTMPVRKGTLERTTAAGRLKCRPLGYVLTVFISPVVSDDVAAEWVNRLSLDRLK
jgi:hypothetical protein